MCLQLVSGPPLSYHAYGGFGFLFCIQDNLFHGLFYFTTESLPRSWQKTSLTSLTVKPFLVFCQLNLGSACFVVKCSLMTLLQRDLAIF